MVGDPEAAGCVHALDPVEHIFFSLEYFFGVHQFSVYDAQELPKNRETCFLL